MAIMNRIVSRIEKSVMRKHGMHVQRPTYPQRIRNWVMRHFGAQYVDRVTQDLIDVAAGNRNGNDFEIAALVRIFPD